MNVKSNPFLLYLNTKTGKRNIVFSILAIIIGVVFLFPIYWLLSMSFKSDAEIFGKVITVSPWTNVFVKAYDFILGMFLILEIPRLMDKKGFRTFALVISEVVIVVGIFLKSVLPTPMTFNNLIYAVMLFICFFALETTQKRKNILDDYCEQICKISYEVFLVHHIIIYYIGDNLEGQLLGLKQICALFVTEVFIMAAMALFVKNIVAAIKTK